MTAPHRLYADALRERRGLGARDADGRVWSLDVDRWLAPARGADARLLRRAAGPVLDVGCGPGRHVCELLRCGVAALGVDVSPAAVRLARDSGAPVHHGSVFGPVPDAGRWQTALLLDGNLGIGGDPAALLARVGELLAPAGRVLCETDVPGAGLSLAPVRLDDGTLISDPFAWARVGRDALGSVAATAGLRIRASWDDEGRWFAELERSG